MRIYILISIAFFFGSQASAQTKDSTDDALPHLENEIENRNAEFIGGEDSFYKYITQNLEYPEDALINNVEGTVYIRFVIDASGNVTDISVLDIKATKSIVVKKRFFKSQRKTIKVDTSEDDYCLGTCAANLVANFPKWKPAMRNGKPVGMRYTLPVKYSFF